MARSMSSTAAATNRQAGVVAAASETCAPCVVKGKERRLALGIINRDGVPVGGGVTVKVQVFLLPPGGASPMAVSSAVTAPYEGGMLQDKGVYVIHPTLDRAGFVLFTENDLNE